MNTRRFPFLVAAVLTAWIAAIAAQQPAPASQAPLRDRIQAYLDEWRASASFPGASVGIVLTDGTAFGVVTGVSDRAAGTPMKVDDSCCSPAAPARRSSRPLPCS